MRTSLPRVTDIKEVANSASASSHRLVPLGEITIVTEKQVSLYRELHQTTDRAIHPRKDRAPAPTAHSLYGVADAVFNVIAEAEELSVFYQAYSHLAEASAREPRMADKALELSGTLSGPGAPLLRRLLRFATRAVPPETVQQFIEEFLETASKETIRSTLAELAAIEWVVDRHDTYRTVFLGSGEGTLDTERAQRIKFLDLLGLPAESGTTPSTALSDTSRTSWEAPDWWRIRDWRRRYVDLHTRNLDWAITKATVYQRGGESLAPYWHPGGLEAGVVTQLRQEADRASSARLWQIADSTAQMALRRVSRRVDRRSTPFDPRHLPSGSSRGMMLLDTPFVLPDGRRIVGYLWGPWAPREEEGWALSHRSGGNLEPLATPQAPSRWTWVTPLTCDQSLPSLPFSPYGTLLVRPGDVLEPQERLRDPDNPDHFLKGIGRRGNTELMIRHVRALWELLTQHKRSSVRVLSEEVHAPRPRDQRADRRRGISDSGQVTNVWVDPDAGEQYRAQRYHRRSSGGGHKLTVRYWRGEHERRQCPNSHAHASLQQAGGCVHDEITIPEHVVGPSDAPWSDRMLRARSRADTGGVHS